MFRITFILAGSTCIPAIDIKITKKYTFVHHHMTLFSAEEQVSMFVYSYTKAPLCIFSSIVKRSNSSGARLGLTF